MKVRILRRALEDLAAGREFYDRQCEGVGGYFFDSLFTEIDSLVLYAGIHRTSSGIIACWRGVFHMPFITASPKVKRLFIGCSTVGETPRRCGEHSLRRALKQKPI
jgi:hypothetical protein